MNPLKVIIAADGAGKGISRFLSERVKGLNRQRMEVAFFRGLILVNEVIVKEDQTLKAGDLLDARLDFFRQSEVFPEEIPLDILFEDDALLVLNKPAGMACHAGLGVFRGTLLNALAFHFQKNGTKALKNGLVQRLDRQTRGLMVVAKNLSAFHSLKSQIDQGILTRVYAAEVWGVPEKMQGTISDAIGRLPGNEKELGISAAGKEAITDYTVIETNATRSVIECRLHTGRTHQIRIHLSASLGCPIVGDKRYGKETDDSETMHLCSKDLRFTHPTSAEILHFSLEKPYF